MRALLFLGLTTAFFQYPWPSSKALFLFAKLIGKTKQAEALCQGQCEEIQPTHDGVNQCHGSQSVGVWLSSNRHAEDQTKKRTS